MQSANRIPTFTHIFKMLIQIRNLKLNIYNVICGFPLMQELSKSQLKWKSYLLTIQHLTFHFHKLDLLYKWNKWNSTLSLLHLHVAILFWCRSENENKFFLSVLLSRFLLGCHSFIQWLTRYHRPGTRSSKEMEKGVVKFIWSELHKVIPHIKLLFNNIFHIKYYKYKCSQKLLI